MAKLTDDAIAAMLLNDIGQSVGFSESRLAKERTRVLRYYDGEYPKKTHGGDSGYMSLDVYDGVESMMAQLLEVFSGNSRPVSFKPMAGEPDGAAQVRTEYCTHVLFDQNRGFQTMQTVIKDGLLGRAGVCKIWWEPRATTEHYDLSDSSMTELQAFLANNPDAEVKTLELHEDGVTIKRCRLKIKKDRSQVRITPLPPEEFGIAPRAEDIPSAELVFHRHLMTISELLKAGYPKDTVLALQDNDRVWLQTEPELLARFEQTDDLIGMRGLEDGQTASRQCMVYECYRELDVDDSGESQLYKITMVGDTILDKEPVDRKPFVAFVPLPRPHAFWGSNYALQLVPTQNARTHLTRSIINHAMITNNPRLQVVRGGVVNPRELMENRLGGIVNVTRPDAIAPLPQTGLNPFVFQTINMLDEDKEEITGISKLSQGLNKDALSKQNSQGMVQELISVSQIRQKIVARNFAENFLRPLYSEIHRLVSENESRQKVVQIAGSWVPVDFTAWPEDADMEVSFALGYGEQEKEAQKWVIVDKYLSQDPGLQPFYPPQKRYQVVKKALEASGIKDVNQYILKPEEVKPPQPNPMQVADLQVKQADAAVKKANAQAAVLNLQIQQQELEAKKQHDMAKITLETNKADRQFQLHQDQLAHKVAMDAAELALTKAAQARGALSASVHPND